ncbi:hypothetical protein ACFU90_22775 [Streptomyces noursei]|uniref:Uncharacterized protein n=1 Tax=Streptomyces noursei TaxID=1971 RepID=A0A059VPZ7_STRNR|nr:hypothetical protein [Streptomyces noursei]AKA08486.1 hypothetical protein SAZ_05225 [Streptomyces noursei ZPM]AIA01474.1 hypothetical protein DC74_954 [Streptomyces noursei]EXU87970.1 hypothetical protein P354_32315 [Streptomyces noursei PD-1]MCZ0970430.1 hypothetical protein [Streptomyces noursei]UWS70375.1 hypothetical protein N1H47_03495 [Streptomyces noursei]
MSTQPPQPSAAPTLDPALTLEAEDLERRRQNTMVLAVGGLAVAGLGVALLSMLTNRQNGMIVVRM